MKPVPTYRELERPDETELPLAWGVWGPEDQMGTLNHISEAKVREAAQLVKRGVRFNLDLPLHVPYGEVKENAHVNRRAPKQTLLVRDREHLLVRDEKLD